MSDSLHSTGFNPRFLAEALALVSTSTTRTSPNPRVGCVIVQNGQIVGRGVTRVPGEAHAEVVAITDAGRHTLGADMYVTLEPCCHVGRTQPCNEATKSLDASIMRLIPGPFGVTRIKRPRSSTSPVNMFLFSTLRNADVHGHTGHRQGAQCAHDAMTLLHLQSLQVTAPTKTVLIQTAWVP